MKTIRYENNRADKIFLKDYLKEISRAVASMDGQNDFNKIRDDFEKRFSRYIGRRYAVTTCSGTDALQVSLISLGIGRGDKVIVPDITYISTALAVKYAGSDILVVDVKKSDLTIDENEIRDSITKDTKAIIAVHMFGHPCEIETLRNIADEMGVFLIEDCCQAMGSIYRGRHVGSFGDLAAFSFSYYKPLSSLSGNGGVVVFDDHRYKESILNLMELWRGSHDIMKSGRKFHRIGLADLLTAGVKFRYFETISRLREKIKKIYENGLGKIEEISVFKDTEGTKSVMENYMILAEKRDLLNKYLVSNGVISDLPYKPLHLTDIFSENRQKREFPVSSEYYEKALHLPLYSFMKEDEARYIIDLIKQFYE